jgi:hypothetical protein
VELLLSRGEIRRRVLATVGMSPNALAVSATMDQINQYISEANAETMVKRKWQRALITTRFTVGQDQTTFPFPANWTPSSIVRVSFWDADGRIYIPLRRQKIELVQRSDPLNDPTSPSYSPTDETTRQGRPLQYDPGLDGVINIWPPPDQIYEIMMEGYPNADLLKDTDISVVDALCIIYWASGCYFDMLQDTLLANKQQAKFAQRIRDLSAWQQTGQTVSIDSAADFSSSDVTGLQRYDYRTHQFPGQDV